MSESIVPGILKDKHETILWRGKPDPLRHATRHLGKSLIGFAFIMISVFAIRADEAARDAKKVDAMLLPVRAFVAMLGSWFAVTPVLAGWAASKSQYAVTNNRIAIYWVPENWSVPPAWQLELPLKSTVAIEKHLLFFDIRFDEEQYAEFDGMQFARVIGFLSLSEKDAKDVIRSIELAK